MNSEHIMIDLLGEKERIKIFYQKKYHRTISVSTLITGGCLLLFWGIGHLVYRYGSGLMTALGMGKRWTELYHLSITLGTIIGLAWLILLIVMVLKLVLFERNYTNWLKKQATNLATMIVVSHDERFYHLSRQHQGNKIGIIKETSETLSTTLEGDQIMIGQTVPVFGVYQVKIFILTKELGELSKGTILNKQWQKKILLGLSLLAGISLLGSYWYLRRPITFTEMKEAFDRPTTVEPSETSATMVQNDQGLILQAGPSPTHKISETNQLYLDANTRELFMTTDGGENWQFVPIQAEWLRGGDYTLTSGTVPWGYWMDKTFEISSTFSWFLYSPNEGGFYFLSSTDNGQNWESGVIDETLDPVRYRKVDFFPDGSGVAVFSLPGSGGKSSEYISIHETGDYGKTWNSIYGTTISSPIQNASFISLAKGFIATRNDLYYTENYGRSFKDAIIVIPDDYQANGLDVFQSPNEIVERSSSVLEGKFNLVRTAGVDIGKMFACLFQSEDGGQTWTFVEQLSQIEQND